VLSGANACICLVFSFDVCLSNLRSSWTVFKVLDESFPLIFDIDDFLSLDAQLDKLVLKTSVSEQNSKILDPSALVDTIWRSTDKAREHFLDKKSYSFTLPKSKDGVPLVNRELEGDVGYFSMANIDQIRMTLPNRLGKR